MNYYGRQNNSKLVPLLLLAAALSVVFWFVWKNGRTVAIAGIPEPVQTEASGGTTLYRDGYKVDLTYLYAYEIEALVLHTQDYPQTDLGGKLAPRDLALGWGSVAQYNEVIDFHWGQTGRWYFWHVDSWEELAPVGGEEEVSCQSCNNHLIAADSSVKRTIGRMRRGDHIKLKGYLIDLKAVSESGSSVFTWTSSVTRTDTGNHACELIYVTDARILK
ncbi:MAG: hypothetical protein K6E50_07805 [Lachnospiraceae bacterium]|nr:hypothetical protein [Lachnospiraceae bacterium]